MKTLYENLGLEVPSYIPETKPDIFLNDNPVKHIKVPGIGDNDDEDNGTIFYYDEPLVFIAELYGQQVILTLLDEGYKNSGYDIEKGYAIDARGWKQYIAFPIDNTLLHDIYNNRVPFRAYMEQNKGNYFIQENWCNLRGTGLDRWDKRNWYTVYQIFKDVPILEKWKPQKGVLLNPNA